MPSKNFILITGLMRRPDLLRRSLEIFIRLQQAGIIEKIIISTWRSEVEAFRAVILPLLAGKPADVAVMVVAEDPNITIAPAYNAGFMHQSILRERGLDVVAKQDWVLKTRADCFISEALLRVLFSKIKSKLDLGPTHSNLGTLSAKLWVPWMHVTRPFYLEDVCHFGRKRDLALLHNFDISAILHAPRTVNIHQTLYYRPFRDKFDIFYEYFRLAHRQQVLYDSFRQPNADALAADLQDLAWSSPPYVKLLMLYWKIVFANFLVYSADEYHDHIQTYASGGQQINEVYTVPSIFREQPSDIFSMISSHRVHLFEYNNHFVCRDSLALEMLIEKSMLCARGDALLAASRDIDGDAFEADEAWLSPLAALNERIRMRRLAALPVPLAAA